MNYYWKDHDEFINDDNLYVEFKTEADLLRAIYKNIQYKNFKIKGIKRGVMWPVTHAHSQNTVKQKHNEYATQDREGHISNNSVNSAATGANITPIINPKVFGNNTECTENVNSDTDINLTITGSTTEANKTISNTGCMSKVFEGAEC